MPPAPPPRPLEVARFHELPVWRVGEAGVLLGDRHGWVMLPPDEAPDGVQAGDVLRVFVTTDKGDEVVATRRTPLGQAGDLVATRVVGGHTHGVFVDWGLPKDLFVPWKHQHQRLVVGDPVVVYIAVDRETGRPVGHTRLAEVLSTDTRRLRVGQEVGLLVYGANDLGWLCAVDGRYAGLLYADRLDPSHCGRRGCRCGRTHPRVGDRLVGYVERVREEGRLDLSMVPVGQAGRDRAAEVVAEALAAAGGFLPLTDDSPPELIRSRLGLSKKQFKQAVGALYRQRRLVIEEDGIRACG